MELNLGLLLIIAKVTLEYYDKNKIYILENYIINCYGIRIY